MLIRAARRHGSRQHHHLGEPRAALAAAAGRFTRQGGDGRQPAAVGGAADAEHEHAVLDLLLPLLRQLQQHGGPADPLDTESDEWVCDEHPDEASSLECEIDWASNKPAWRCR